MSLFESSHMPPTPVLRRRNGRPQACEPCRKRKVACDNSQPICERCIKRRQVGDCVYIVSSGSPKPASRSPPSPACSASLKTYRNGVSTFRTETSSPTSPEGLNSRSTAPGYLGFTSFSAVFEETQISLCEHNRRQGTQDTPSTSDAQSQASVVQDSLILSPRTQEACMYILRNVPEPSRGRICLRGSPVEAWVYYFLGEVLDSLYDTFGHYFGPQRSEASLQELARIISRNTALPFSDDDDITPSEWMAQFSGPNTRWETLGLLFAFWDFTVNSITLEKSTTQDEYGRPSRITKEAVDFCVELCNGFSAANSMFLFLSFRQLVVETQINGDISRQSWKLLSETVSLLTYMGYHVLPDTPRSRYVPTFATEIKRKLYYHIYTIHMSLVSLTGRPPLMSHRYCTTPIPLDLPNSVLFCDDKQAFVKALDGIDDKGWDKAGRKLSSSPMRARAKTALLREEILYFALEPKQDVSVEALVDVKARVLRLYHEEIPKILQNGNGLFDGGNEVGNIYFRLVISLEHLLNRFFIERLLLRHGHIQNELLSVSFDMVTNTLLFWTHRDSLSPWRADCEWLIMAFGVPAGGILCQELLKPTVLNDPRITRSTIIQKLSLLVGFLDWIKPSAPNGDLCGKCKMIIMHVLDQALNAPATGFASADGFAFDWDLSTQVDFDFDLLDTFGWTRSEFPLSQQSNA